MGVTVHVPLRIRWPSDAATSDGPTVDALEAALDRGVEAAIDRARREVFAPRAGHARARPLRPTITWLDARGSIDRRAREELESRVAAAIERTLARRRIDFASDSNEVVPSDPSERVKWAQMRGTLYRTPSYNGDPDDA